MNHSKKMQNEASLNMTNTIPNSLDTHNQKPITGKKKKTEGSSSKAEKK